jgi:hypothetical protein
VDISGLGGQFDTWLKLLSEYATTNLFFDDPITKSFREEFFAEFEIIYEDADISPINTKQNLFLDSYLDSVEVKLAEFTTHKNLEDLQEIKADTFQLKDNLTRKSKKMGDLKADKNMDKDC